MRRQRDEVDHIIDRSVSLDLSVGRKNDLWPFLSFGRISR